MKVENPLVLAIVGILILGGIFFLMQGKANSNGAANIPATIDANTTASGPLAPELVGISGYINAPQGFKLADVKGKVILVDFWTYSCINCIRTQPYLNAWQEKYADKGLVIVGVHTPEFDFEKKLENVQEAVQREGIKYAVVLDNDYQTWRAYKNQYWPRKYLIDAQGVIRYDHIGEGGYEETEAQIQQLLKERDDSLALTGNVAASIDANDTSTNLSQVGTPEIYMGYSFARAPYANDDDILPDIALNYHFPATLPPNLPAVQGSWIVRPDYIELDSNEGQVELNYTAKNINIVASNPAEIRMTWDGISLSRSVDINEEKLYSLIDVNEYGNHTIILDVFGKGFRLYTFTFG